MAKNLGHILEADVHVRFTSNRIECDTMPSFCNGIAICNCCPAADEKARGNQNSPPCCSSSLRSFFTATTRNLDVFPRSIPSLYAVFEYHSPQKSRTIRALCS